MGGPAGLGKPQACCPNREGMLKWSLFSPSRPMHLHSLAPQSRVLIVDSSAILKSCFEGYRERYSGSYNGRPLDVTGLYGYMNRVRRLYMDFDFEALVHVIDPPGGSHYRYGLFPDYKANRDDDDPSMAAQKALLPKVLSAFGERWLRLRGMESDDVIATLAQQCRDHDLLAMIISPDKDLLQLVEPGVSVARYIDSQDGRGKTYDVYDTDEHVFQRIGVRPDQVADWLALVGDSSDNIPGVDRVGDKTAAKLLNEYGDLASLMTQADRVAGKLGENLRQALPLLPLYQQLTTVLRNVPKVDLPVAPNPDPALTTLFRDLLTLPDHFPDRFVVGNQMPAAVVARPATPARTAPVHNDALRAPAIDPLDQPANASPANAVLGELFGEAPPSAQPFDGLGDLAAATGPTVQPRLGGRPPRLG